MSDAVKKINEELIKGCQNLRELALVSGIHNVDISCEQIVEDDDMSYLRSIKEVNETYIKEQSANGGLFLRVKKALGINNGNGKK